MNRHQLIAYGLGIALVGTAARLVFGGGPSGGEYDLSWNTFDGGGGTSTGAAPGGGWSLSGTIGQSDAGATMIGGTYSLSGGFWAGVSTTGSPPCPADFDGNDIVNGLDLALLLGAWTGAATYFPCPPPEPQDLNGDCKVNGLDLALLLGAWGACP